MEFKQLEIKPEGSWLKRTLESKHTKKTLIYIGVGAVAGLVYFYFSGGNQIARITIGEIIKYMAVGGFLGFFVANNPCARNKC